MSLEEHKNGMDLIAAERQRQLDAEGWTPEHDDNHVHGEMADAAACYALTQGQRNETAALGQIWPWDLVWWKPSGNRIRDLEKAGALVAAEIDRLLRLKAREDQSVGRDTDEQGAPPGSPKS